MARKRSELQMKSEGFFYVPQWPTERWPEPEKREKFPHRVSITTRDVADKPVGAPPRQRGKKV